MNADILRRFMSPLISKPILEQSICCPLYYNASDSFHEILCNNGYELILPEGVYFLREEKEIIAFYKDSMEPFTIEFYTTLKLPKLENLFADAIRKEYKNKYVLIRGSSLIIQKGLKSPKFDIIKHTLSSNAVSKLENSIYNFEVFCEKYSNAHLSNTLGLLLYAPPGYGKSFILRSLLNKLLKEMNFTIVQLHQATIMNINLSQLLDNCKLLFPCIFFIEDIDLMFYDRKLGRSATGELLETLEGLYQVENVVIIATTNSVDEIDKALLRPGRFDYLIEIESPSSESKKSVVNEYMKEIDFDIPETILEQLVKVSETFAELKGGFQHLVRTYMSTNTFPSNKDIEEISYGWKESRTNGVIRADKRKVGLI